MKVAQLSFDGKTESLIDMACQLQQFVQQAATECDPLYKTERKILAAVLKMGHSATDAFLQLQGNGDLGPSVATDDGRELHRSESPVTRHLRTVFGEHTLEAMFMLPARSKESRCVPSMRGSTCLPGRTRT